MRLLDERGVNVYHVTIYRWVQRFTPEFVEAARGSAIQLSCQQLGDPLTDWLEVVRPLSPAAWTNNRTCVHRYVRP